MPHPLPNGKTSAASPSMIDRVIRFCLEQKLFVALLVAFLVIAGIMVAPFDWRIPWLPRRPVPVDAIPDIGENQQIVFTEWMGRSPKDVQDQVTYPLTVSLLGIPGVKTVRSTSMFGFSMINVIFEESVRFEAAQNRIVARLNSLPPDLLPAGVKPSLGPFATALGQIFWYTLEGRDPEGNPVGGWDLHELRALQDWIVRFHLQSAEGIAEVASVGGYVQEYQVDVDPDALREHGVSLMEVAHAVRRSNLDVGARQIEHNGVDYLVRSRGFIRGLSDLENTAVRVRENVPLLVRHVARVALGPAYRDGALDKEGVEVVGGVVTVRHGYNPLAAIRNVKRKIEELAPALPSKAVVNYSLTTRAALEAWAQNHGFEAFIGAELNRPAWTAALTSTPQEHWPRGVTLSRVTIVPFYDRTHLIHETLGTLNDALYQQVLVTTIVIVVMAARLGLSLLISAVLPLAVLGAFIAMKLFGVDANIVSLSGIAIAIGTIVDTGIILCQNIVQHLGDAERASKPSGDGAPVTFSPSPAATLEIVYRGATEVGGAVLTAIATTVVGFLPVFVMTGPEGKLFRPLAFTKTFCLIASVVLALTVVPAAAHLLLARKPQTKTARRLAHSGLVFAGAWLVFWKQWWWAGGLLALIGSLLILRDFFGPRVSQKIMSLINVLVIAGVGFLLAREWMPLGLGAGWTRNVIFVALVVGGWLASFLVVQRFYEPALRWILGHKRIFLGIPLLIVTLGYTGWLGFERIFGFIPRAAEKIGIPGSVIRQTRIWSALAHRWPGLGREFMPPLDEGSFLYMPTLMPHASLGEALDVLQKQDRAIRAIPEVESVVGKIGRANTALDPAPINMIETIITYKPEYITDENGRRLAFRYDRKRQEFVRHNGQLVPDPRGRPYRQWRDHIRSPDDIWKEILAAADVPGVTSAPRLQPIAARIVMLQTGMRAPFGVKIQGATLESVEQAGLAIERFLREVPEVEPASVIADRIVGKPYWEIEIDRAAIARYGLQVEDVQDVIEIALGGRPLTWTVEGRARYPVRVRYMRERRDSFEAIARILIPAANGTQIPLSQLATFHYVRGPESIKTEDTFLVGYVLFDKKPGYADVDVVEACQRYLSAKQSAGELRLPAGVTYRFAGNYENERHARQTLAVILPMTLLIIFLIIYFQFRSVVTTSLIFSSIFVSWAGGLLLIWLYGQPWFLDLTVAGVSLRKLFQVHPIHMSVAIWVGFLALFGIASDDAVVMCALLRQRFSAAPPRTVEEIREATVFAGRQRIRACLMTTATTVLALLPVLTSTGRGADIMVPMALPCFGGMVIEVMTLFMTPVLYAWVEERRLKQAVSRVSSAGTKRKE